MASGFHVLTQVSQPAERAQGFPQVRPTFPVSGAAPDVRHEDFGSKEASREGQPARKEASLLGFVFCWRSQNWKHSTRSGSALGESRPPRAEPSQLSQT